MPTIALVTARAALELDEDMPYLLSALRAQGVDAVTACWDDAAIDWSRFDAALLRSTWDYVDRLDEFLAWARRCAGATRLLNPASLVEWNVDKHYLQALHSAGVAVVPTRFVEPQDSASTALDAFLAGGPESISAGEPVAFEEFVIKPSIGAGSRDAARYRRADRARALAHLVRLVEAERRSAMLQPYLGRVDDHGETAVVYLDGEFSHAFRKGPLLRLDQGCVEGLFATEQISERRPDEHERRLAAMAYATLPGAPPLYARIDMIQDPQGAPVVLELELTEPSLYFACGPGSADRLARALVERCGGA